MLPSVPSKIKITTISFHNRSVLYFKTKKISECFVFVLMQQIMTKYQYTFHCFVKIIRELKEPKDYVFLLEINSKSS